MSDKKILVGDMSRETAIGILKLMLEAMEVYDSIAPTPQRRNAVQMAIASLETDEAYQLEYENLELCEDCISRKEAISWIENLRTLNEHYHPNAKNNHLIDCDSAIDHLKQVPSVLPRAKTGHWIAYHYGAYYLCSNCKEQHNSRYAKYCPNCGTKMDRKVRISNDKRNYRGF